ncbi:LamG domain-containing protein [Candidatus Nanohalovita haloferacivicina]|nr:LamG domain-containing protein [Candidatus Nanohalobia archaeon BNXNv]
MSSGRSYLSFRSSIIVLSLFASVIVFSLSSSSADSVNSVVSSLETEPMFNSQDNVDTSSEGLQSDLTAYYRFDNAEVSEGFGIHFDGSDDYIEVSDSSSLDNTFGSTFNFTLTAWFKMHEWEDWRSIQNKAGCGSWSCTTAGMWTYGDGVATVMGSDEGGNPSGSYVRAIHKPSLNEWHHAVSVGNGTHIKLYIDGELKATNTISDYIKANLTTNNEPLTIGRRSTSKDESINGSVAAVRSYNRTLSASEIQKLYRGEVVSDKGLIVEMGLNEGPDSCDLTSVDVCFIDGTGYSNSGKPENFNNNLLNDQAGWINSTPVNRPKFSSSTGTLLDGVYGGANDASLVNFDFNETSGWSEDSVEGDFSLALDGYEDRVNAGHSKSLNITGEMTINLWAKPGSHDNGYWGFVSKTDRNNGWQLITPSGSNGIFFEIFEDGNNTGSSHSFGGLTTGEWTMITLVVDGKTWEAYKNDVKIGTFTSSRNLTYTSSDLFIGDARATEPEFKGNLDSVRIYERALDTREVNKLYESDTPERGLVGRWNFESGDRATAYDTSGIGLEGLFSSKALGFNGYSSNFSFSDDEGLLDVPNGQSLTASAWVKPLERGAIFGYRRGGGSYWDGWMLRADEDSWRVEINSADAGINNNYGRPNFGKWQHVALVIDNNKNRLRLYQDGRILTNQSFESTTEVPAPDGKIGSHANGNAVLKGKIDEVKIYNKSLTDTQIKELAYN